MRSDREAWSFEPANARKKDGTYCDWQVERISLSKPNVPEGSIRNLTRWAPAAAPEPVAERDALIGVLASLAAAISLLERGGKKAAPSDKMFETMLNDYRKSLEAGRAALSEPAAPLPDESGEPRCQKCGAQVDERWDCCEVFVSTSICDCERSHNGLGLGGRECDCGLEQVAHTPPVPSKGEADRSITRSAARASAGKGDE